MYESESRLHAIRSRRPVHGVPTTRNHKFYFFVVVAIPVRSDSESGMSKMNQFMHARKL